VHCAREALNGKVIVAFADTLFTADFKLDPTKDGVLWVKQIDDPSAFGVVKLDENGDITDFVEKPVEFVSDLAMIGIYYFKKGEDLAEEIAYLLENNITKGGEYQLPDALKRMTEKGAKLAPGKVDEWMDCGNPPGTIATHARILELKYPTSLIDPTAEVTDSVIIPPCYIGPGVKLEQSVIGPHVSIGTGCGITDARIKNTIVQSHTSIAGSCIENSMIGNRATVRKPAMHLSVGDYNTVE
jgi:glucose-1-phosphate thymidylyltransferase